MTNTNEAEMYNGLASYLWAAYDERGKDYEYFKRVVQQHHGLALDVGCGTGRLLRGMRRMGYEVEGVDIAEDQLAHCRRLAEADGLSVTLYHQAMQDLDLPKQYDAIIIPCSSLVCVMDRRQALEALRRMKAHLAPGGVLVFNLYLNEQTEAGDHYPTPWVSWTRLSMPHGQTLFVDRRVMSLDPIEQVARDECHYVLVDGSTRDSPVIQEETRAGGYRWYTVNEARWMIELAGLTIEKITGDYTDTPLNAHHRAVMMFHTR
jgi:SAM-dependent methyltransferase